MWRLQAGGCDGGGEVCRPIAGLEVVEGRSCDEDFGGMDPVFGGVKEGSFAMRAERFGAVFWEPLGARGPEEGEDLFRLSLLSVKSLEVPPYLVVYLALLRGQRWKVGCHTRSNQ